MKVETTTGVEKSRLAALPLARADGVAERPRRGASARTRLAMAVDAGMLVAAAAVAEVGSAKAGVPSTPLVWQILFPAFLLVLLGARGMYRPRLFIRILDDLRATLTTAALAAMTVLSLRVLFTDDAWVAAQTARIWVFASVYLLAGRAVLSWAEVQARRRGESAFPTLVVGAGKVGRLTARRLLEHPELGLRPVGFLDKEPLDEGNTKGPLPVLGASWDLEEVVTEHGVRHIVVAFSTAPQHVLVGLLKRCEALGVQVSIVPRFFEKMTGHVGVEYLGGIPLISAEPANPRSWQFAVKYAVDRLLAALLLILALPAFVAVALAVAVSLGRPVFFRQERIGRDGRVFEMLKFRTMRLDSAETAEGIFELPPDTAPGGVEGADRRTRLGSFLRRTSLDELPQLVNVLKGEMSLVGPRPERPEYAERFEQNVYRYGERHRVKAGMTGWAQVNGLRGQTSLADRVEWDNYYIENWSLWLDVKIMLLTLLAVLAWRPAD